ncbi:hypothetical protein E5S69_20475 [Cupriavidus necator]|uniref:phage head spike fiber domain-containing protein n=1 Tax=Cupriavidus necator TaxID=106590 RepID=UPI00148FEEDF|nr:hypothetical protein [Cupriavidus necator]NOV25882.1 hypothetical protein [Cupriavidus necator]
MLVSRNFVDLITFTRASPAWRFNSSGLMVQESNGVARFDYDPVTRQPRGLLIEESRTNLLLQSNALDNATWVKNGVTVTPGAAIGPDGALSLAKIVTNNGASFTGSSNSQSFTKAASAIQYTYSIFAKAGELPRVRLFANGIDTTTARCYCDVDLTNGSVAQIVQGTNGFADLSVAISAIGGGIYRIAATFTTDTATTLACRIYPLNTSGSGDGVSGIFTGFTGAEVGAFATSYIATTTASVTRTADVASLTDLTKIGFNPSLGTFYVEAMTGALGNSATQNNLPHIVGLMKGTSSSAGDYLAFRLSQPAQMQINVGNTGTFSSINFTNTAVGSIEKMAAAGQGANISAARNGVLGTPLTARTWPADVDTLWIGSQAGTTRFWNGWVRAIRYYPKRMTDSELQALTA